MVSDHELRNQQFITLLEEELKAPLLGSGYRPSVWCINPGCHAPIPASATHCPHCAAPQEAPLVVTKGRP